MDIQIPDSHTPTILAALSALDGRPEPRDVQDRDGKKQTVLTTVPYRLSGKTRLQLARWLSAIRTAAGEFQAAHDALVRQYAEPSAPDQVPPARRAEFEKDWAGSVGLSRSYRIDPVPTDDLDPDHNQLPITVLSALAPILV